MICQALHLYYFRGASRESPSWNLTCPDPGKKQLSTLGLIGSALPGLLEDNLVDTNRVFDHASGRKPLLHLAAACLAELFSKHAIIDQPQHRDGEFFAIWFHDQGSAFAIHYFTERPALRRNARQSRGHRCLQGGSQTFEL